jgi:hypothetical protein
MDVSDKASYYIEKERNKGSQMGHTKKILKKVNLVKLKTRLEESPGSDC